MYIIFHYFNPNFILLQAYLSSKSKCCLVVVLMVQCHFRVKKTRPRKDVECQLQKNPIIFQGDINYFFLR